MANPRLDALTARLEKGHQKTMAIFEALNPTAWQSVIYEEPYPWTFRDLLAHFVSSEERLLLLVQNVATGGEGAPAGFDFDAFNAQEQTRLTDRSPQELLTALNQARNTTLDWLQTLEDSQLENIGRHPALGEVTLETMITAIYGHQLMHMREVKGKIE
ncbi:MAG: DinB family protein [Anaerolineales bacterium]|nr:DinB family protein [Anaerolineales bacterium]